MTDYLAIAQQAAQFIDGQQIEGRAKWRRADQSAAGIASFLIHLATTLKGQPVKLALPDWPQAQ